MPGETVVIEKRPRRRVRPPLVTLLLVLYVAVAALGPVLLDYDHVQVHTADRLAAPGTVLSDGTRAWFGTDHLGRDVLSQVVEGARISLILGITTVTLAMVTGSAIGVIAGYFGGRMDSVLMRLADIQLAFPGILMAILIASILGPSFRNVILTLAIATWVIFARVARGQTLAMKKREFIEAAWLLGGGPWHIAVRNLLPQLLAPLLVVGTVELGLVIVAEASLSFLGLGTPPDTPSWGLTISAGRDYLASAWWIAVFPGAALALVVILLGRLGDRLRDRLDPAMRSVLE